MVVGMQEKAMSGGRRDIARKRCRNTKCYVIRGKVGAARRYKIVISKKWDFAFAGDIGTSCNNSRWGIVLLS